MYSRVIAVLLFVKLRIWKKSEVVLHIAEGREKIEEESGVDQRLSVREELDELSLLAYRTSP